MKLQWKVQLSGRRSLFLVGPHTRLPPNSVRSNCAWCHSSFAPHQPRTCSAMVRPALESMTGRGWRHSSNGAFRAPRTVQPRCRSCSCPWVSTLACRVKWTIRWWRGQTRGEESAPAPTPRPTRNSSSPVGNCSRRWSSCRARGCTGAAKAPKVKGSAVYVTCC